METVFSIQCSVSISEGYWPVASGHSPREELKQCPESRHKASLAGNDNHWEGALGNVIDLNGMRKIRRRLHLNRDVELSLWEGGRRAVSADFHEEQSGRTRLRTP